MLLNDEQQIEVNEMLESLFIDNKDNVNIVKNEISKNVKEAIHDTIKTNIINNVDSVKNFKLKIRVNVNISIHVPIENKLIMFTYTYIRCPLKKLINFFTFKKKNLNK